MRQRTTAYTLLGIVVLFLAALAVDASNIVPGFPTFAPAIQQGVDLQGGLRILYQAVEANPPSDSMQAARDVLEKRVNGTGVAEPVLNLVGNNRISVELPGVKDPDMIRDFIRAARATQELTVR